jgi:hypothetical protein
VSDDEHRSGGRYADEAPLAGLMAMALFLGVSGAAFTGAGGFGSTTQVEGKVKDVGALLLEIGGGADGEWGGTEQATHGSPILEKSASLFPRVAISVANVMEGR